MTDTYRVGWITNSCWWHPHRPWQAEARGVRYARRSFTARGAERKVTRDAAALPRRRAHQAWRWWRSTTWRPFLCRMAGHRAARLTVGPWPKRHPPARYCGRCLSDLSGDQR
jgi:hypothetical protein